MASSWDAPTPAELRQVDDAEKELGEALEALNKVLSEDLAKLREALDASGLGLLSDPGPVEIE
jgi:hypothetical protein